MDCKTCKENRASVPYIVHEAAEARHERHIKRLIIALVIVCLLWFATICLGAWAWMQYDYDVETSTETYSVDLDAGEGNANYIGQDGDIVNGTSESD